MWLHLSLLEGKMGSISPIVFLSELPGSHWGLDTLLSHQHAWKGCTHDALTHTTQLNNEPGPAHVHTAPDSLELSPQARGRTGTAAHFSDQSVSLRRCAEASLKLRKYTRTVWWPVGECDKQREEVDGPGQSGSLSSVEEVPGSQELNRFAHYIGQMGAAAQQGGVHGSPVCLFQNIGFPTVFLSNREFILHKLFIFNCFVVNPH